eukprot:SAG22_NODE_14589_length_370_cov_1.516605_1_plen_23_part_10
MAAPSKPEVVSSVSPSNRQLGVS